MMFKEVVIVGAGVAGLSAAACLSKLNVDHIVLEKDDCPASLWRNRAYDRLHLHLDKEFCKLPHKPHSDSTPTFLSRNEFLRYIDDYIAEFDIQPVFHRWVKSARYDRTSKTWTVRTENTRNGEPEEYRALFLVVATGENGSAYIPDISGLEGFDGEVVHSSMYKNGKPYADRDVLVVGAGNSGMEIALDLYNYQAKPSIVVRGPVHVLSREAASMGLHLLKHLPLPTVDSMLVLYSKFKYGDLQKYGLSRPEEGPFFLKESVGKYPILDVGTVDLIKAGRIQVYPGIKCINENTVEFENGHSRKLDAIIFATGYKSTVKAWLKDDDDDFFGEDGFPSSGFSSKWKGNNGLYCVGFTRHGFHGIAEDAENVAQDITMTRSKSQDTEVDIPTNMAIPESITIKE